MDFIHARNSTSFPYIIEQTLKNIPTDDVLRYHQRLVIEYVMKFPDLRGLLLVHQMGSGKTILGISICEALQKHYPKAKKIFLVSKSLHGNVEKNLLKLNIPSEDYILLSSNANNMLEQIQKKFWTLDDCHIIVDEAQLIFNSIVNGSKNAIGLYYHIMNAKKVKLFFLSGTPCVNDFFELAVCYNMLHGYININNRQETLFPEYHHLFHHYFDVTVEKNRMKFKARIVGLTSVYKSDKVFPKLEETKVHKVKMSDRQFFEYKLAKQKEDDGARFTPQKKMTALIKKDNVISSYKINTRQLSNALFPESALVVGINEFGNKAVTRDFKLLTEDFFKNIKTFSPKVLKVEEIIKSYKVEKGYVYSQFLDSGLNIIGGHLERNGYNVFSLDNQEYKPNTFAYITGEIDPEVRDVIIEIFNSDKNTDGKIIKVLLISSAVAQGISLNECNFCIVFEPYWNMARINQVINRGRRLDSHLNMTANRQYIQPHVLLAETLDPKVISTDITLWESALESQKEIDIFLKMIEEASIDCLNYKKPGIECFMCHPTDKPLYLENYVEDISAPIFCEAWNVQNIKAEKIVYKDKPYYYTIEGGKIKIYLLNPKLELYEEMFFNNPIYKEIYALIQKSKPTKSS
jgi:hypothetical protein